MPTTKRGPETLFDPGDILAPFVAAQKDLSPDAQLAAPPVDVLANADFLPRLRLADGGLLASGGFALLLSLANGPHEDFPGRVLYAAPDLDAAQAKRLGAGLSGVAAYGRSRPELALPFLPEGAFTAARDANLAGDWGNLADRFLDDIRLGTSPLDGGGKASAGPGKIEFPLVGHGSWRVFVRLGAAPFAGRTVVAIDDEPVAELDAGPLGRGMDWLDCGTATFEPGPPHGLTVAAPGRGVYVAGVLAVPEDAHDAARETVAALAARGGARLVVEAEEATAAPAVPMAPRLTVPLLAAGSGVETVRDHAALRDIDPMGGGTLAVEGDAPGEAAFTVRFPVPATDVVLEAYPRLFGDKAAPSYVAAAVSVDGKPFTPLFRVEGKPDGRWEDVYGRREVHRIPGPATTVTVRFAMRQAQLSSQANAPNHPMRLVAATPVPGGATLSFGAAARLPAELDLAAPVPGTYAATLRLVGPAGATVTLPDGAQKTFPADGALDVPGVAVTTDAAGRARLRLAGPPEAAVDRVELSRETPSPQTPPALAYSRVNPGRYALDLPEGSGGRTLVFAEAFHPGWKLRLADGREVAPLKGYGFLDAFPLPSGAAGPATLVFRDEAVMERMLPVVRAAWAVLALTCAALLAPWPGKRARGKD